jgi:hypothetical protein
MDRAMKKETPFTDEEMTQLINFIKTLGDDCLLITGRDLGTRLGLDAKGLSDHLKTYFVNHNPNAVLRGQEKIGAGVLVLYIPPDYSGPGGIFMFSVKPEHRNEYLIFRSESPDTIN